jgi:hypothetical protein
LQGEELRIAKKNAQLTRRSAFHSLKKVGEEKMSGRYDVGVKKSPACAGLKRKSE